MQRLEKKEWKAGACLQRSELIVAANKSALRGAPDADAKGLDDPHLPTKAGVYQAMNVLGYIEPASFLRKQMALPD